MKIKNFVININKLQLPMNAVSSYFSATPPSLPVEVVSLGVS